MHRCIYSWVTSLCFLVTSQAFAQANLDDILAEAAEDQAQETVQNPKDQKPLEKKQIPLEEVKESDQAWIELAPNELSNLATLVPFEDVAVIQRKFLPKTHRFDFTPFLGAVINNAFFMSTMVSGKLGYYFSEMFALEASVVSLGTSERQVTKDLKKPLHNVSTATLVTSDMFYGLDIKWIPIYGKMGFMNRSIAPFEMYFVAGGGITRAKSGFGEQSAPTIHFEAGQNFALSKSLAFRWGLGWYWFQAKNEKGSASLYNDIHFGVGVSFFFPGAKYR